MNLSISAARSVPQRAGLVFRGVFRDAELAESFPQDLADSHGFEGGLGATLIADVGGTLTCFVGLGAASELDVSDLRKVGANVAKAAKRHGEVASTVLADALAEDSVGLDADDASEAFAEGLVLGSYRFDEYKSSPAKVTLKKISVVGSTGAATKNALARGEAIGSGQALARDLVNEPGGTLTPVELAKRVQRMAKGAGLQCKVMDLTAIRKAKLGGLLGVNRGSTIHPRFVELTYDPPKAKGTLAFVGKGITFDAGGLSIKTGSGMMTMKMDMGGAAAVIGAMSALKAVGVQSRVRAYLPMTDNMLGGDATRPGDVLTIRNGKTIEVLNTDAEGRLVLADALCLASEAKPDAIIDLATLTGACMVALGPKIAGLMSNDDDFAASVANAADKAGERVWRLPLPDDYKSQFDSPVADMKNIGAPHGGAITAGLILSEFVGDGIAWTHLDIAGPAWTDGEDAENRKGGTGFGVRTLIALARSWS